MASLFQTKDYGCSLGIYPESFICTIVKVFKQGGIEMALMPW